MGSAGCPAVGVNAKTLWFSTAQLFATSVVFSLLLFRVYFAKGAKYEVLSSYTVPYEEKKERNEDIYDEIAQTLTSSCRSHTGYFLPPDVNSIIFEYLPDPDATYEVTYWESLIEDHAIPVKTLFWEVLFTVYFLSQLVYSLMVTVLLCTVLFVFLLSHM